MKKIIILLVLSIALSNVYSQGLLSFFTKEGEKFWVVVNGKKINDEPKYLVEKIPVDMKWGKVKIIFEDPKLGTVDKTYQVVDVDNNWCHVKYMIRKGKKGKYEIRDIDATFTVLTSTSQPSQPSQVSQPIQPPTQQQTQTQQNVSTNTPQSNNINMGVNITETPTGVQIQTSMPAVQQTTTVVTHQTTTTTSSTPAPQTTITATPASKPNVLPGYSGPIGCPHPMSETDFQTAINSIKSKSFEDSKLSIAKQITGSNCLLSSHVKDIMKTFSFESTRLEFAKFAYKYTYDKGNYFKVNDAFQFESSIDELNEFISNK